MAGLRKKSGTVRANQPHRARLSQALRNASYEVLPLRGIEERVLEFVPRDVPLAVTTSVRTGQARTVEVAERLLREGYRVTAHVAARQLHSVSELEDFTERLRLAGGSSIFAVAGDLAQPEGPFVDAVGLVEQLVSVAPGITSIGITGYPEGHALISDDRLWAAMRAKSGHADYIATQMCFDAGSLALWADQVKAHEVYLPVRVGVPGVVSRQKLMRISAGLGLGQSARFLTKQPNLIKRFLMPSGFHPGSLVSDVAQRMVSGHDNLDGFHFFTFNDVQATEEWRQKRIFELTE